MRTLDKYVLKQFLKIFLVTVLGVPLLFIVINLTDSIDSFLRDGVSRGDVFAHYLYLFPYNMLVAFPIACLLAAVFTVSSMTRHSEMTAGKAGGMSFHRITAPLLFAGLGMSLVALALTEVVPHANRRSEQALGESRQRGTRLSFVFRGRGGRFYMIQRLTTSDAMTRIERIRIDREGTGYPYPSYSVDAPLADWDSAVGRWIMKDGTLRIFPEPERMMAFQFEELHQVQFTETPVELLATSKNEDEMGYTELKSYIDSLDRSGSKTGKLRVQLMMRIAFPFTCLIIVLFGTPLASTTKLGGASMAIGIALATTMLLLGLIRISEALGAAAVLPPAAAAWLPNAIFLSAGLYLSTRVKT